MTASRTTIEASTTPRSTAREALRSVATCADAALRTAPEAVARDRPGPAPGRAEVPRAVPRAPEPERGADGRRAGCLPFPLVPCPVPAIGPLGRVCRTGCPGSGLGCEAREGGSTGVAGGVVELLLDAQQLVVLGDALGARGGAGLDLAAVGGDGEVGDGDVLGLPRAVAHHAAVAVAVGQVDRVEGFGERADLVDLDQQRVRGAGGDAAAEPLGVGDEQVVADDLHLAAEALGHGLPAVPVL